MQLSIFPTAQTDIVDFLATLELHTKPEAKMNTTEYQGDVEIIVHEDIIFVKTPYYSEAVNTFRHLDGQWDAAAKMWCFLPVQLDAVKDALMTVYGDHNLNGDCVDVELDYDALSDLQRGDTTIVSFGRMIAERSRRDWRPSLPKSCQLLSGGWPSKGGSIKNPSLDTKSDTVVLVKGVSKVAVDAALAAGVQGITIR